MTTSHDSLDARRTRRIPGRAPARLPVRLPARVLGLLVTALLAPAAAVGPVALAVPASASGVVGAPAALRCATQSIAEQAANADAVFVGTAVSQAGRRPETTPGQKTPPATEPVTWVVSVDRVLAGNPDGGRLQVTVPPLLDVVALREGGAYVFFLAREATGWVVRPCSGSAPATRALVARVTQALGQGAGEPAPEPVTKATRTPVEDGEPTTLVRLAAPGGALVLVGLLGLVLVGRLGNRPER